MPYKEKIKCICKQCDKEFMAFKNSKGLFCSHSCSTTFRNLGSKHSEETKKKIGIKSKNRTSENNNPNWKGGVIEKNIANYDTYSEQISFAEQVRRSHKDENILEVKCTYCGKWYIPKRSEITNRVSALKGQSNFYSEHRLYCSDECKQECSIYGQHYYPKGFKEASSREVQPELRQMVFERDSWTCKKCKSKKNLHCHHIEGIRWEPLESADIDKCLTYCKDCHEEVHKKEDCRRIDFICKERTWA